MSVQSVVEGRIKFFNEDHGYGFISYNDSDKDLFFTRRGYRKITTHPDKSVSCESVECPELEKQLKVAVLEISDGDKGPVAVEWTIPSLNENHSTPPNVELPDVYCVKSISSVSHPPKPRPGDGLLVQRVVETHKIEYIGTKEDCETWASIDKTWIVERVVLS